MTRPAHFPFLFGRQESVVASDGAAVVSAAHNTPKAGAGGPKSPTPSPTSTGAGASSQVLASSAQTPITHNTTQSTSLQEQPLEVALRRSATFSLESAPPILLDNNPLPLSFAPTMAAPPGGYS